MMFSRLTSLLDRLIPFDFEVEHMPGAKIGLADCPSRNPNTEAKPVSAHDSMLIAANIVSFLFEALSDSKMGEYPGAIIKHRSETKLSELKLTNQNAVSKLGKRRSTSQSENGKLHMSMVMRGISPTVAQQNRYFTYCKHRQKEILNHQSINMEKAFRKLQKFLEPHLSIDSSNEDEVEELQEEGQSKAFTAKTTSTKIKTQFHEQFYQRLKTKHFPPIDSSNILMSIVPQNCKTVPKNRALTEILFRNNRNKRPSYSLKKARNEQILCAICQQLRRAGQLFMDR